MSKIRCRYCGQEIEYDREVCDKCYEKYEQDI